ncbi:MAG: acyl-CoA dehydrogenase family protein, partial [Antricoccus sp.]
MSDDIQSAPIPVLKSPWATPERLQIQQEARQFAADIVTPLANKLDKKKGEFPRSFLNQLGKQGYFGILVDKEYGGMGLGTFEYCMISEELARGWMSAASII